MEIHKKMKQYAKQNDLLAGICGCERMDYLQSILKSKQTPFVKYSIEERINPSLIMHECASIIIIGKKYRPDDLTACDYHTALQDELSRLAAYLSELVHFQYKIFSDTGPLVEKELAVKAGIGFMGKNGLIISKTAGSFFNIGYIVTDLILEPDIPYNNMESNCGKCNKCVVACPGGALSENAFFDHNKCVSYISQIKGELTPDQIEIMRKAECGLYGCLICQKICPYNYTLRNKRTYSSEEENFVADDVFHEILSMNNNQFKNKYGKTTIGWRGLNLLKRNALISLSARPNDKNKESLKKFLTSDADVLKKTADYLFKHI